MGISKRYVCWFKYLRLISYHASFEIGAIHLLDPRSLDQVLTPICLMSLHTCIKKWGDLQGDKCCST